MPILHWLTREKDILSAGRVSTLSLTEIVALPASCPPCACIGRDMTSRSCFSIGEYYDRNRASFYAALQGVRDAGMDLTGWFEYFVEGLSTQLLEVRSKGEMAIRRDALALQHGLSERQAKLVGLAVETGDMTIADILRAHPYLKRRTVQRDLKQLVDMGLFVAKGSTNNLSYRLQS